MPVVVDIMVELLLGVVLLPLIVGMEQQVLIQLIVIQPLVILELMEGRGSTLPLVVMEEQGIAEADILVHKLQEVVLNVLITIATVLAKTTLPLTTAIGGRIH